MAHAYFDSIPDRYVAETLSETFVSGEYKVNNPQQELSVEDEGFPPEPSLLSSITAAFIERDGKTVRSVTLHDISGAANAPADKDTMDTYAADIEVFQDLAHVIEPKAHLLGLHEDFPPFGRLGGWAIDATRRSGHRLIAAHLIFRAPATDRIHHGISYPTLVKEEFPLVIRDAYEPIVLAAKGGGSEDVPAFEDLSEPVRDYLEGTMRNADALSVQAGMPASAVLPSPAKFRTALRMHRRQSKKRK